MELSDDILCLFSGEIEHRNGSFVIDIPDREVELGDLESNVAYRVAVVPQAQSQLNSDSDADTSRESTQERTESGPPVREGDHRTVEIEDIGSQGDGIARVERGYVVIVPDTEPNEHVEIEIQNVSQTVAFGEVVGRLEDEE